MKKLIIVLLLCLISALTSCNLSAYALPQENQGVSIDPALTGKVSVSTKDQLSIEVKVDASGSISLKNLDDKSGQISFSYSNGAEPLVYELGRNDQPYRKITTSRSAKYYVWIAKPHTTYQVWTKKTLLQTAVAGCRNYLGKKIKGKDPVADLAIASRDPEVRKNPYLFTKVQNALAVASGLQAKVNMTTAGDLPGDYKMCVDQPFDVVCKLSNTGSVKAKVTLTKLSAPDSWKVALVSGPRTPVLPSKGTAIWKYRISAPVRSVYANRHPLVAWWQVSAAGSTFTVQDNCAVSIVAPFDKEVSISASSPTEAEMNLLLKSNFPGRRFENLEVDLDIPKGWTGKPEHTTLTLSGNKALKFQLTRNDPGAKEMRVVAPIFKMGEYRGSKRTITDLYVPLGQNPRTAGLWLVDADDGSTELTRRQDTACRHAVDQAAGQPGYMYFGVSENIPVSGTVYVTVSYFDEGTDPFELQYDSAATTGDAAYKKTSQVNRTNTSTWRTHTFALSDARFGGRQKGQADFRIASLSSGLIVAWVSVSKFPAQISD